MTYRENIEAERRALLRKFYYSQNRSSIKVTGAKYAHMQKLYTYLLRSAGQ